MRKRNILLLSSLALSLITFSVNGNNPPSSWPPIKDKDPTHAVGTLEGSFQVTSSGQAAYTIPISVPPGTANMSPLLSISYDSTNSNVNNGVLGMGFSLRGLTAIMRCPSNMSQNGVIHGVDYTDQDRFCLNGQQLVAVKGAYGADGTEYRTYIDTQAKIISYGRQGNGPAKFKVWTKGGQVAEYAFTSDSQISAQGKDSVATWALDKISDSVGNYLSVQYTKNDANGAFYPNEIDYTGNTNANLKPYNAVKFIYETRPDVITKWVAGSKNIINQRMKEVQVLQDTKLMYDYKIAYEISKNSFRSRITSIQQCGASGTCLPPTTFAWQTNEEGWVPNDTYAPKSPVFGFDSTNGGHPFGQFLDIRGTGVADQVEVYDSVGTYYLHAWLNTKDGWVANDAYAPPYPLFVYNGSRMYTIGEFSDIRGTGLPDEVIAFSDGSSWSLVEYNNTGGGWVKNDKYAPKFPAYGYYGIFGQFLDLRGTGLLDEVVSYADSGGASYLYTYLNSGSDWTQNTKYAPKFAVFGFTYSVGRYLTGQFIDTRGSGLPDEVLAFAHADSTFSLRTDINTGSEFVQSAKYAAPWPTFAYDNNRGGFSVGQFIDLRGTGLPDEIKAYGGTDVHAWLNTGAGWVADDTYAPKYGIYNFSSYTGAYLTGQFIDLRGTGLPDEVQSFADGSGKWSLHAWINTGSGWIANDNYATLSPLFGYDNTHGGYSFGQFIDLRGTGLPDQVEAFQDASGTQYLHAWLNKAEKLPDYLTAITNGFGDRINIDYESLSNKKIDVYTKEHNAQYPNMDWQGPKYVAYQTTSDSAANDPGAVARARANATAQGVSAQDALKSITTYHYTGAKFNHLGFGFLGFHQITATDSKTGISKTTTYTQDQDARNFGQELASETKLANGTIISSAQNTWETKVFGDGTANNTYYAPYTKQIVINTYDLNGNWFNTKTTQIAMDDYLNPIQTAIALQDDYGKNATTTFNKFDNITGQQGGEEVWMLGELREAAITVTASNKPAMQRKSTFQYDSHGLLGQEVIEPGDPQYTVTTSYQRDVYGNVIKKMIFGSGVESRSTGFTYDSRGSFVTEITNVLNQKTSQVIDPRFGKPTKTTDPNGVSINYIYDDFGNLIETDYPDKTKTTSTFSWDTSVDDSVYSVTTNTTGKPTTVEYFDELKRRVAMLAQSFDGRNVWIKTKYDEMGHITQKTLPYYEGDAQYQISFRFDVLGRVIKVIQPNGASTSADFNKYAVTITNALNQKETKIANVRGKMIEAIDNMNNHTKYEYDAYGNLIRLIDSKGNTTLIVYDKYGRKTDLYDPDKGHWSYTYDPYGQLVSQADAMGNITTFKYDRLGRMISRTDSVGASTWEYDTASNGIGKLAKENGIANLDGTRPTGPALVKAVAGGLTDYTRVYTYDNLSRPAQTTITVNGKSYTSMTQYDNCGRPNLLIYPNNVQVRYTYQLGYLSKISNAVSGQTYWQLNAMDALGHVTSETRSNGLISNYTYDAQTGHLTDISTVLGQGLQTQKQMFPAAFTGMRAATQHFDATHKPSSSVIANLQKLQQSIKPRANELQNLHYMHDNIGNVQQRDDNVYAEVSSYLYDDLNRLTEEDTSSGAQNTFEYDELGNITYKSGLGKYVYSRNNAGPHAVTGVTGEMTSSYKYNANGDQIGGIIDGVQRNITYTSFSKPLTITSKGANITFYYNANRERFFRAEQINGFTASTLYLGNFELVSTTDAAGKTTTQQKCYIGPSSLYVMTDDGTNKTENTYELLKDNLGSTTDIVDANANVILHYAYSPFGEQRVTKGTVPTYPITHHGFTGHEEIESMNLIHMDGRLYDPVLGRFLSADPFVQAPDNQQDLNRYSYCVNNPLNAVDPSGFDFLGIGSFFHSVGKAIGGFFEGVGHAFGGLIHGIGSFFGDAIHAVGKFIGDIVTNKILGPILQIALEVVAVVAQQYWAVPLISAGFTAAAGGSFGDVIAAGALSAISMGAWGVTGDLLRGASLPSRILVHGLVGGGLSELSGNGFKNGFIACAVGEALAPITNTVGGDCHDQAAIMEHTVASAVVGGTAAALTGGDFANGAITAGFAALFNDVAHETLSADKGQKIVDNASSWEGTRYAGSDSDYSGPDAKRLVGGDCSGITHAAYESSGYHYPYMPASKFVETSGDGYFAKISTPQNGDIIGWENHLAIYSEDGMMWTTHSEGGYRESEVSKFSSNQPIGYYRYRQR